MRAIAAPRGPVVAFVLAWVLLGACGSHSSRLSRPTRHAQEASEGIWCLAEDAETDPLASHGCFRRVTGRLVITDVREALWGRDGVEAPGGLYECYRPVIEYPDGSWTTRYGLRFGVRWWSDTTGVSASDENGESWSYERCEGRLACEILGSLDVDALPDCDAVDSGEVQPVLRKAATQHRHPWSTASPKCGGQSIARTWLGRLGLTSRGASRDGVTPRLASRREHWAAGRLLTRCRLGPASRGSRWSPEELGSRGCGARGGRR
jgi:hypothetical protein